ncbi:MAG TPA: BlaI/MecI/CopY family transcriptional regulator [Thermoplasmata archaeon]|nr:BlaI/MecI/CopY family transcriptional regulator [Thermoplasmata archaeon]
MIGSLEAQVLRALRELDEAPARDVQARLKGRGVRLAYTTVATSLGRLFDKGLVRRRRQTCRGGERYLYRSVNFERAYLRDVVRGVVTLFGPSGVVHLNQELAKLDPSEERELRRRLHL